ncbi:MAG TPA: HAD hydrolase family protein [Streptosporangiaceae bacterium]|nr:HAD hydrolase family protein [Streptosporangiaceae bacterium]
MWFFRAVALDLDGTLTEVDHLSEPAMAAIKACSDELQVILVTGRIFGDLEAAFPGLWSEFDAVVTENGAVLHTRSGARALAGPVDPAVTHALAAQGIATRAGRVLVALAGEDATAAVEIITSLGLDCQVVHNRGAAMILPAAVTKGTGLLAALDELGLSPHNVIAAGDAENDLALLHTAEVGAAVANAVPSLSAQADLHLRSRDGDGVAELLAGPLLTGQQRLCPARRWLPIGTFDDGQPVLIPGSQASLLLAGDTGTGKSYLAGLLAERWIDAGYAVLILDPEGDHTGLTERPGVHLVDAAAHLPSPTDLLAITRPGRASLVLDLSGLPEADKTGYLHRLPAAVEAERAEHGIPHWVIIDEAHLTRATAEQAPGPTVAEPGTCIVTWQPDLLPATFRETVDLTIATAGPFPAAADAPAAAPRATISAGGRPPRPFTLATRVSPHVRHQHKYTTAPLPPHRRFYFHSAGEPISAATLEEFSRHIRHCDPAILGYHISRGDFSRWISTTLADHTLGSHLAVIERDLSYRHAAELERARHHIIRAIDDRYPGANCPSQP